ncbi:MAG: hypothetical protein AAFN70_11745, partial [Planctomycetota bacterium]
MIATPVDLPSLLSDFFDAHNGNVGEGQVHCPPVGHFQSVQPSSVPDNYNRLLNHDAHMTVTVEDFHQSLVDVTVLRMLHSGDSRPPSELRSGHYSREILLSKRSGGQVVQYGIVRLNIGRLNPQVWQEIASRQTPLGRVLINHNVMRQVQLNALWQIEAGPHLAEHLNHQP